MTDMSRTLDDAVETLTHRFRAMRLEDSDVQMDLDPSSPKYLGLDSTQGKPDGQEESVAEIMVNTLCARLVHQWEIMNFLRAFESVITPWSKLLSDTTPPDDVLSTDGRFIGALRILDLAIAARENNARLLSRLAYVQLHRLMKFLERRVALDRRAGRFHRRRGYQNASIVLDIYMSAQNHPSPSRRSLIERKCLAKRWNDLAGPWPIFVLVYSEEAEKIMFDHTNSPP
ncbi:hypothetical protein ACJZ2D_016424 [Fusarium nematophilum]